jgi:hypothetical protein
MGSTLGSGLLRRKGGLEAQMNHGTEEPLNPKGYSIVI